jgi:hypothetical protein
MGIDAYHSALKYYFHGDLIRLGHGAPKSMRRFAYARACHLAGLYVQRMTWKHDNA